MRNRPSCQVHRARLRVFYEAPPVKPFLADFFHMSFSNRIEARRVRRSWTAVGGESISAAGRRPSFAAPSFFHAASVRRPSSLNLLFGLPRIPFASGHIQLHTQNRAHS